FIALGAGFNGELPPLAKAIWIRRPTDARGRVFLDRPSLEPELSPLDEYKKRYQERKSRFSIWAEEQLIIPEGFLDLNEWEACFLGLSQPLLNGSLTLLPENFRSPEAWQRFIARRKAWKIQFFEVRDDLLSSAQQKLALES